MASLVFYTAQWIDADKALECGIAAAVLPDKSVYEHALAKAQEIARWPVNALREIKACLKLPHRAHMDTAFELEQSAMARQAGSPENIEAITAFMEKRPANFKNI